MSDVRRVNVNWIGNLIPDTFSEIWEAPQGCHALVPWEKWRQMVGAVRFLLNVTSESSGIAGFHLNGDIAAWEELDGFAEVENNRRALAEIEADDG